MTHHGAKWHPIYGKVNLKEKLTYPGLLVTDSLYNSLSDEEKEITKRFCKVYDKEYMRERWKPAIDFAREKGLKLQLGEFGCLPNNSEETRLRWIEDVVSLCNEYNIAYTLWEYNSIFGFAERRTGRVKKQRMLNLLTKSTSTLH